LISGLRINQIRREGGADPSHAHAAVLSGRPVCGRGFYPLLVTVVGVVLELTSVGAEAAPALA
jgi:hypothetical protein